MGCRPILGYYSCLKQCYVFFTFIGEEQKSLKSNDDFPNSIIADRRLSVMDLLYK